MAARKSERQMNLTIVLLAARGYLTRHQIRRRVEGYAGLSDSAFERAFERDKDDLRRYALRSLRSFRVPPPNPPERLDHRAAQAPGYARRSSPRLRKSEPSIEA